MPIAVNTTKDENGLCQMPFVVSLSNHERAFDPSILPRKDRAQRERNSVYFHNNDIRPDSAPFDPSEEGWVARLCHT